MMRRERLTGFFERSAKRFVKKINSFTKEIKEPTTEKVERIPIQRNTKQSINKENIVNILKSHSNLDPWMLLYVLERKFNVLNGDPIENAKDVSTHILMLERAIESGKFERSFFSNDKNSVNSFKLLARDLFNLTKWQENLLFDKYGKIFYLEEKFKDFNKFSIEVDLIKRFSPASFAEKKKSRFRLPRFLKEKSNISLEDTSGIKESFSIVAIVNKNGNKIVELKSKEGNHFKIPLSVVEKQNPRSKLGFIKDAIIGAGIVSLETLFSTVAFVTSLGAVQRRIIDMGSGKELVYVLMPWHNIPRDKHDNEKNDTTVTRFVNDLKERGAKIILPSQFGGDELPSVNFSSIGVPKNLLNHGRIMAARGANLPIVISPIINYETFS